MFYVVEQSTDQRCRKTRIETFTSLKKAIHYASDTGFFTHDNPKEAQNYHRTFRKVYKFCGRMHRKTLNDYMKYGSTLYPVSLLDAKATYLWTYGEALWTYGEAVIF